MKTLLLSTALAAAFAAGAWAQQDNANPFYAEQAADALRASDLIGARIYVSETPYTEAEAAGVQQGWDDIGEVNDVILSRQGMVEAVLVDIGGFLGIGERQVALSMSALRFASDSSTANDANDWFLVMQGNRALLEGAPEYTATRTDATGAGTGTGTGTGTGAAVGTGAGQGGSATATGSNDVATNDGTVTDTDGIIDEGTGTAAGTATTGAAARPGIEREGYSAVAATELTSDMLEGATVLGSQDETLGTISNLVIAEDGKITDVIVDVGGFLGLGTKPVALKLEQLQILRQDNGNDVRIFVGATREDLEAMPASEI